MSIELLQKIRVNGTKMTLPSSEPSERFSGWKFFSGTNTITKETDLFVAVPVARNEWNVFRYSGKKGEWTNHKVGDQAINQSPSRYLAGYDKVDAVKEIQPIVAKDGKPIPVPTKGGGLMTSLKKVFGRFGKAEKGAFAMSVDGSVAVRRDDNAYAILKDGKLVNMDTFALDIDAFYYIPVTPSQLKPNDVMLCGAGVGFVMGGDANEIQVYDVNNETVSTVKPATHFLMKEPFVTKVVSLLSMGGEGGIGGMNPLMMMMLLGGDKGLGGDSMKTFLMMSMLGGGQMAGNPMLMMMLMGGMGEGGGKMDDLLPLMLMGGGNLGGLFGGCCGGKAPVEAKPGT